MKLWPRKKPLDPVDSFWEWFRENQDSFRSMSPPNETVLNAIEDRLARIEPGLVPEFALEGGRATTFVISADGVRDRFRAVMETVKRAPALPGWKVVAFRQPGDPSLEVEIRGVRLGAADLWFSSEADGQKTGLSLYVRGLTESNRQELMRLGFILLDNALGEFLVETAVGFIDWQPLPSDPGPPLRPFPEIQAAVRAVVH
ncbi:MAG: hypothetical protein IPJ17_05505 [Holophagales bacterium]|nr:MAG: hypothetical protein IPJ17_05505 [Holophagales bacterium]